jgi:hypothetical protein
MPDTRLGPRDVALKMVARAKARGPGEVVSLFVGRTRDAISSADVLKMYQRRTDTRQETSVRPTFVFREGGASDGAAYARDIGTESPETFRRRLADGTHCFLVLTDDLVVHTSWMTTDKAWTREVASYVCPPPGEGYIYESFTRPELRGQGIYPFALERITNWMVHHGLTRATARRCAPLRRPASPRASRWLIADGSAGCRSTRHRGPSRTPAAAYSGDAVPRSGE